MSRPLPPPPPLSDDEENFDLEAIQEETSDLEQGIKVKKNNLKDQKDKEETEVDDESDDEAPTHSPVPGLADDHQEDAEEEEVPSHSPVPGFANDDEEDEDELPTHSPVPEFSTDHNEEVEDAPPAPVESPVPATEPKEEDDLEEEKSPAESVKSSKGASPVILSVPVSAPESDNEEDSPAKSPMNSPLSSVQSDNEVAAPVLGLKAGNSSEESLRSNDSLTPVSPPPVVKTPELEGADEDEVEHGELVEKSLNDEEDDKDEMESDQVVPLTVVSPVPAGIPIKPEDIEDEEDHMAQEEYKSPEIHEKDPEEPVEQSVHDEEKELSPTLPTGVPVTVPVQMSFPSSPAPSDKSNQSHPSVMILPPLKSPVNSQAAPSPIVHSPLRETVVVVDELGDRSASFVDLNLEPEKVFNRNPMGTAITSALLVAFMTSFFWHVYYLYLTLDNTQMSMTLALLFYLVSLVCVFFVLIASLVKPMFSTKNADLYRNYFWWLIAGMLECAAVLIGGGEFGFLGLSDMLVGKLWSPIVGSVFSIFYAVVLYSLYTRPQGTSISKLVHPFREDVALTDKISSDSVSSFSNV